SRLQSLPPEFFCDAGKIIPDSRRRSLLTGGLRQGLIRKEGPLAELHLPVQEKELPPEAEQSQEGGQGRSQKQKAQSQQGLFPCHTAPSFQMYPMPWMVRILLGDEGSSSILRRSLRTVTARVFSST